MADCLAPDSARATASHLTADHKLVFGADSYFDHAVPGGGTVTLRDAFILECSHSVRSQAISNELKYLHHDLTRNFVTSCLPQNFTYAGSGSDSRRK